MLDPTSRGAPGFGGRIASNDPVGLPAREADARLADPPADAGRRAGEAAWDPRLSPEHRPAGPGDPARDEGSAAPSRKGEGLRLYPLGRDSGVPRLAPEVLRGLRDRPDARSDPSDHGRERGDPLLDARLRRGGRRGPRRRAL